MAHLPKQLDTDHGKGGLEADLLGLPKSGRYPKTEYAIEVKLMMESILSSLQIFEDRLRA
jgi:hypothetical protein